MGQQISQQTQNGYDAQHQAPMGMPSQQLCARRELVEQLDPEPLFDYLVQNGAMEASQAAEIRQHSSLAKVNLALLSHLDSGGKTAHGLFIIALRHTGQHHLANLLDDSVRIKALSGSGYLSKSRHKGQVSLMIHMKAIQLPQEVLDTGHIVTSRDRWISLEDIQSQIRVLTEPKPKLPSKPSFIQLEITDSPALEEENRKSSCFCGCFSGLFSSRKKSKKAASSSTGSSESNTAVSHEGNNSHVISGKIGVRIGSSEQKHLNADNADSDRVNSNDQVRLENLRKTTDMFREKSDELFHILRDRGSDTRVHMLKYFEQDRGVLVLDAEGSDGLVIVNICMKFDQLDKLRKDHGSGLLTSDLEHYVITDEVLLKLEAHGVHLSVDISEEDLELAEQELS